MVLLAVLGLCIAAGYRTRLAAAFFFVGFTYTESIEATLYLNHYWFLSLTALLVALLPTHHRLSFDARAGRVHHSAAVPQLVVFVLRAQVAVVYIFAGVAKLNPDWLFQAQPLRLWFTDRAETPLIGSLLTEPGAAYVASWASAVFDLTIVAWLLWPRSRPLAYCVLCGFHFVTGALFAIGVFPVVMMALTLVFFSPDWPERFYRRFGGPPVRHLQTNVVAPGQLATVALVVFGIVQLALPLRHYLYDSNVRWSDEGYYGGWRVMLSEKVRYVLFHVTDSEAGTTWTIEPTQFLTDWQTREVAHRPDLIVEAARILAQKYYADRRCCIQIRAQTSVTLNGRPSQEIIDPTVDLVQVDRSPWGDRWITPLDVTL